MLATGRGPDGGKMTAGDPNTPKKTTPAPRRRPKLIFLGLVLVTALLTAGITALLTNIFTRKQEAKNPYLKFVEVDQNTTDPAKWGMNWPHEYDGYKQTVEPGKTNYGGGDALPAEKADKEPWLKRMFAGYAFSL